MRAVSWGYEIRGTVTAKTKEEALKKIADILKNAMDTTDWKNWVRVWSQES